MMNRQLQAYSFAAATVLCWSTAASAFKLTLMVLDSGEMLLYAALSSLIVLALIVALSGGGGLNTWGWRDYARSAGLGAFNPCMYYLLLFGAYDRLPAQEAQPLNFVWPIVLVLLSVVILGQRLKLFSLIAMLISFSGVVIISTRGDVLGLNLTDGLGVGLALSSAVVWSLYWLYGVKDTRDPTARLCVNFAFGCGYILLYQLWAGDWRLPPLLGLAGAAYIGLFEMGLAFVLWQQALQRSQTTAQVSNLIYLTPFGSLLVIQQVVGEPIYRSTLIGLVLIIIGIIYQQYGEYRQRVARSV
jgi:drug/metabolite transporter (DMT)-like permease